MGVPSRAAEIPGEIGTEAVAGAAGQLLGVGGAKLLGKAARGIKGARGRKRIARRAKLEAGVPTGVGPTGAVPTGAAGPGVKPYPSKLPSGQQVSHVEMVEALEKLGPRDKAAVEPCRRPTGEAWHATR
jgi:hypothetical protein